ncbi:MAG: hypothetical protein WC444_04445 [Candidatus Paceibacterota bacterium]
MWGIVVISNDVFCVRSVPAQESIIKAFMNINKLCEAGIRDIVVSVNSSFVGDVVQYFANRKDIDANLVYVSYDDSTDMLSGVLACKSVVKGNLCIVVANRIIDHIIQNYVNKFMSIHIESMPILVEYKAGSPAVLVSDGGNTVSFEEDPSEVWVQEKCKHVGYSVKGVSNVHFFSEVVFDYIRTARSRGSVCKTMSDLYNYLRLIGISGVAFVNKEE